MQTTKTMHICHIHFVKSLGTRIFTDLQCLMRIGSVKIEHLKMRLISFRIPIDIYEFFTLSLIAATLVVN